MADRKGLVIKDSASANDLRQRQRRVLLRRPTLLVPIAGPEIEGVFVTLANAGERHQCNEAVNALNG